MVFPTACVGDGRFSWEYLLPACTIASENMASSFQDFLAETFASYSPSDSHLALETILAAFLSAHVLGDSLLFMWSPFPSSWLL